MFDHVNTSGFARYPEQNVTVPFEVKVTVQIIDRRKLTLSHTSHNQPWRTKCDHIFLE